MRFEPIDRENPREGREGPCDQCGATLFTFGGSDASCACGAIFNCFGQRLRDDLYSRPNPSTYDDDIDDMSGYELAMGFDN